MDLQNEDNRGMQCYEHLVNNIDADEAAVAQCVTDLIAADTTGQFSASAARFLAGMAPGSFTAELDALLKSAIAKDRELAYLPDLLPAIWGADYTSNADTLRETDDNFRRIYKRVHPSGIL